MSTVGWVHHGRVSVTIDLGVSSTISGVAFVAAGGGHADVFFPAVTAVLTSDDGDAWFPFGAVGSGALLQDRSKAYPHKFEAGGGNARGRYVRLVFQTEERYLFMDEIEVYAGDAGEEPPRREPINDEQLDALLKRGLRARWVAGEWREFERQTRAMLAEGAAAAPGVQKKIDEIGARVRRLDVSNPDEVETLRLAYTSLRAEAARPVYGARLHTQRVYPWSDLRGSTFPPQLDPLDSDADLTMWQDEYESAAWAMTNLTGRTAGVTISVTELTDAEGRRHSWRDRLWLRSGMAIQSRVGYRVLDALPLVGIGDSPTATIEVPPGEYRLLWLNLRAYDLEPGVYRAKLRVREGGPDRTLLDSSLTLRVAPLRMPAADGRALSAYVWEYLVGWRQPPEAAEDLRAHGSNTFCLHPVALPRPVFNRERTQLKSVDFTPLDEALARCGKRPRMHSVFWGGNPSFWGLKLTDPTQAAVFKQFILAWAKHLEQRGIGPESFFFYPLDEETSDRLIRVAQLINEADPRLQVFWNRVNAKDVKPELMHRLAPHIDIACPNILTQSGLDDTSRQEAAFREIRGKYNPTVWTYACKGPGRFMLPDRYYRDLSWRTFRIGGCGTGFWCYSDGSTWDAYEGKVHYGVVYYAKEAPPGVTRVEAIIPSRRWEAFREGTEDFEHLDRLQKTIFAAKEAGTPSAAIERAASVLSAAVEGVLKSSDDPLRYARARRTVTEAILELRKRLAR